MTLRISGARIDHTATGEQELSALVGDQRLWFRVPGDWPTRLCGDPFVIAALLPAMRLGVPLQLDDELPVSPALLDNLQRIQEVFRLWGPALRQPFRMIPVHAAPATLRSRSPIVLSFFSGGIDGFYTMLHATQPITHAVFARGIDMQLENPVWDEAYARNAKWLAGRGVPLVPVTTNVRFVGHAFGIPWGAYFGAGLAAMGHALSPGMVVIAAGHTWRELWPDGSHPLADPLWSSGTTTVVHHGREVKRWQKLAAIAHAPEALDVLRVCWQDQGYNCGRCEKCLRTMVLLRLLGLGSPTFPPLTTLRPLARLRPSDRSEACFVEEALALAVDRGDAAAARALRASLKRWELHRLAGDLKRLMLGTVGRGAWLRERTDAVSPAGARE
jgi:hypothetical protein